MRTISYMARAFHKVIAQSLGNKENGMGPRNERVHMLVLLTYTNTIRVVEPPLSPTKEYYEQDYNCCGTTICYNEIKREPTRATTDGNNE